MTPAALADLIRARADLVPGRFIVAIAGPPASGKTTLAAELARQLGPGAKVMPMDGFHLDNAVLAPRGHLPRKGAPHTFDRAGLAHALGRIRAGEEVAIPVFDRALDAARAGAEVIGPEDRLILVEGNYLLLDQPGWRDLRGIFDLRILLTAPEAVLLARLRARWQAYGKPEPEAFIAGNDLPNARLVLTESKGADIVLSEDIAAGDAR